jgi:hypothetical protein
LSRRVHGRRIARRVDDGRAGGTEGLMATLGLIILIFVVIPLVWPDDCCCCRREYVPTNVSFRRDPIPPEPAEHEIFEVLRLIQRSEWK